jgi:quercetin dioxygenase-like cupin family protein
MIVRHDTLPCFELPGLEHRTLAGHEQGVGSLEVWLQTLAPGAASPVHRHACEEVVVILSGSGELTIDGETRRFAADSTLIVPPDAVHQIVNSGSAPLVLLAALGAAPVRVRTDTGEPLPVPWAAP